MKLNAYGRQCWDAGYQAGWKAVLDRARGGGETLDALAELMPAPPADAPLEVWEALAASEAPEGQQGAYLVKVGTVPHCYNHGGYSGPSEHCPACHKDGDA